MLFREVADYFDKIENVSSRLEMTDILAELFGKLPAGETKKIVYLLQGKIAPTFEGKEIGFGEKLLAEGIAKSTGFTRKEVDTMFSKKGDLGETAEEMVSKKQQGSLIVKDLTIEKVFFNLEKMSRTEGTGSQELKKKLLAELFNSASPTEAKYIARIPLGSIRLGVGDPTIMDSFAIMLGKKQNKNWKKLKDDEKRKIKFKLREEIEGAYNIHSDLGEITFKLKEKGIKGLNEIKISPGTPIRPTAAERLPSAKEIIDKLGKCAVEAKYDGFRVQLSKKGNEINIFSRQNEEITKMFPEIIEAAKKQLPNECIVEGEALAYNDDTQEFYPFQITIQRKRKYDVEKKAKEYPLKLFLFDIMFVDGENQMQKPFKERRKKLESILKNGNIITLSDMIITDKPKELEEFFETKIGQGLEGIIAKDLNAPYIAGARKFAWIKLKRSYKNTLDDTLDLAILGYYKGKGKRTRFGLGALLVGVYNNKKDVLESIAKIGTGMTEEMLKELESLLSKTISKTKPNNVVTELEPDYWVIPQYVVETIADEITKSPLHACAEKNGIGLALRFPRMKKIVSDKKPETATTTEEVVKMFEIQKRVSMDEYGRK
jgi:DNA ligase 1